MDTTFNFSLALPEILLLVLASCVLIFDAFSTHKQRHSTFVFSLLTLAVVAASVAWQWSKGVSGVSFGGLFVVDEMAHFLKLLSCAAVAATLIYGREYAEQRDMMERGGELYTLTLMALLGQMIMISANSMLTAYLGVELMSFALYALVALRREHRQSIEAALKYFVLGALASGILLYGMSMIFGATGHLEFPRIAEVIANGQAEKLALVFGVVFVVAGLAFKLTAAPFHMWTPDVYQGAPTTVTLIIGAAPKLAAFAVTMRFLVEALHGIAVDWQPMLLIMAVLSLALGNLTAIMQKNLKRMLAYSTISHMGFIFLGLLAGVFNGETHSQAYGASLFYVVIYVLTTLSTFGLILIMSRRGFECENISDLKGLSRRNPGLALVWLLSMFSLAGIPPLSGFAAKLSVLQAVVGAGQVWLAVFAVLMSLIGAFYYLRVVKVVYFDEPEGEEHPVATGLLTKLVMLVNGVLIIGLGLLPGGLMDTCIRVIQSSLQF